jgi:SHS2 domain-containing protein
VTRGVAFLDHTADVGIAVEAATPAGLFHNAAVGMLMLLRGEDDEEEPESESESDPESETLGVEVAGDGYPALLAMWLRELLFLHEVRGLDYVSARFDRLDDAGLSARVRVEPSRRAVREIKGVTLHGLEAEESPGGWRARVIFDV